MFFSGKDKGIRIKICVFALDFKLTLTIMKDYIYDSTRVDNVNDSNDTCYDGRENPITIYANIK